MLTNELSIRKTKAGGYETLYGAVVILTTPRFPTADQQQRALEQYQRSMRVRARINGNDPEAA